MALYLIFWVPMGMNTCTHLISVVWEIYFVKYLGCLVLNRLYFNLMRRILSLSMTKSFLKPLYGIQGYRMSPSSLERC